MNVPVRPQDLPHGSPERVTTGPIQGSRTPASPRARWMPASVSV